MGPISNGRWEVVMKRGGTWLWGKEGTSFGIWNQPSAGSWHPSAAACDIPILFIC